MKSCVNDIISLTNRKRRAMKMSKQMKDIFRNAISDRNLKWKDIDISENLVGDDKSGIMLYRAKSRHVRAGLIEMRVKHHLNTNVVHFCGYTGLYLNKEYEMQYRKKINELNTGYSFMRVLEEDGEIVCQYEMYLSENEDEDSLNLVTGLINDLWIARVTDLYKFKKEIANGVIKKVDVTEYRLNPFS